MAVIAGAANIEQNIDYYLEMTPSPENIEDTILQYPADGQPINHYIAVRKQMGPLKNLKWKFHNLVMDIERYFK